MTYQTLGKHKTKHWRSLAACLIITTLLGVTVWYGLPFITSQKAKTAQTPEILNTPLPQASPEEPEFTLPSAPPPQLEPVVPAPDPSITSQQPAVLDSPPTPRPPIPKPAPQLTFPKLNNSEDVSIYLSDLEITAYTNRKATINGRTYYVGEYIDTQRKLKLLSITENRFVFLAFGETVTKHF